MDVRKYFPSIDHALLKTQLRRLFKDPRLLRLLDLIVDLGENPEDVSACFPGDDLFTPLERRKGLPIGNLTSQILANLYLDGFDHWVKESLRVPGYLRFMDDFVLLDDSKTVLQARKHEISDRLEGLRLVIHAQKSVIRRVDEGVPFLGYVVWPGCIRVRGETTRRFRRRHRRQQKLERLEAAPVDPKRSLAAWRGHVGLAGTFRTLGELS
jgi:hypothetical protein